MNRLAILGYPIAHSRSPAMHSAALAALGMGDEWSYEAIEVGPAAFEERVLAIAGEGFRGANVTVPHKGAALSVADVPSETAREIGAANTLCFQGGEIRAENTDAPGLLNSLPSSPAGKRALVLGAGGAGRAAVWALVREGAELEVWNRTELRSRHLCEELGGHPVAAPDPLAYELIVNTTTVGMEGEDPFGTLPLSAQGFQVGQVVVDMVYASGPTVLLRSAEAGGAVVVDGIEVLVQQGALSLEIWTGREAPLDVMRAAAYAA
jgi:shikimate dehydrogenase